MLWFDFQKSLARVLDFFLVKAKAALVNRRHLFIQLYQQISFSYFSQTSPLHRAHERDSFRSFRQHRETCRLNNRSTFYKYYLFRLGPLPDALFHFSISIWMTRDVSTLCPDVPRDIQSDRKSSTAFRRPYKIPLVHRREKQFRKCVCSQ